jgi:hypothetical protein
MRGCIRTTARWVGMRCFGIAPVVYTTRPEYFEALVRELKAGADDAQLLTRVRVRWWATEEDRHAALAAFACETNRKLRLRGLKPRLVGPGAA